MNIAIHQPNFLPWLGFFSKIKSVDNFVFFDDVQFERGKTFTSRTKILIQGNEHWLTIPVLNKAGLSNIKDIKVEDNFIWKKKHLRTIELSYKKSPFFDEVFSLIQKGYENSSLFLIDYNISLIINICNYLEIKTSFMLSSEQSLCSNKQAFDKIICLIINSNCNEYVSGDGKGSIRYIDESTFLSNNIKLTWQNYSIKEYKQQNTNANFIPYLSIIDLLFNHGNESINFL